MTQTNRALFFRILLLVTGLLVVLTDIACFYIIFDGDSIMQNLILMMGLSIGFFMIYFMFSATFDLFYVYYARRKMEVDLYDSGEDVG